MLDSSMDVPSQRWRRGAGREMYEAAQAKASDSMTRLAAALRTPNRVRRIERLAEETQLAVAELWQAATRLLRR